VATPRPRVRQSLDLPMRYDFLRGSAPTVLAPRGHREPRFSALGRGRWAILPALALGLAGGPITLTAQATPLLTGAVRIDLGGGRLAGTICVRGAMEPGRDLTFVLNAQLRVTQLRGRDGRPLEPPVASPSSDGHTQHYTVRRPADENVNVREGSPEVCIDYSGEFPIDDVAAGRYRAEDRSELVAFNGRTLRARGISRWYPALSDPSLGVISESTAFDLEVSCVDCEWLYVNGGPVAAGPTARFTSLDARELLLLAGDFPVVEVDGSLIIGEAVAADTARMFLAALEEIQEFYSGFLEIPFGPQPDILRIIPLREERRGHLWGFFSDPALALIGMPLGEFVRILRGPDRPVRRSISGFLAHELAHRYFGWNIGSHGPFRDMFGEPFASYLELKAVRHFSDERSYREAVRSLRESVVGSESLTPLTRAGPSDFAVHRYRYGYAPLLLFALEDEVGEAAMKRLLREILLSPPSERLGADYPFLQRAAMRAGITPDSWVRWERDCVMQPLPGNDCLAGAGTGSSPPVGDRVAGDMDGPPGLLHPGSSVPFDRWLSDP